MSTEHLTADQSAIRALALLAVRAEEKRIAILEERLHMVRWLYHAKRREVKLGFLSQPSFVWGQIGPFLPSKTQRTNGDIRDAANLWCSKHRAVAEARYGHIRVWNTSLVTNMNQLFNDKRTFNDDLSRWDTSNVTTMNCMFYNAHAFNGDISRWNVSNVTDMRGIFHGAHAFNGDIHAWDVSNVTYMGCMFYNAHAFNGDISKWTVSCVTDMRFMFRGTRLFNADISTWDVTAVFTMVAMFQDAIEFKGDLTSWNVTNVTRMDRIFLNCPIPAYNKPSHFFGMGY